MTTPEGEPVAPRDVRPVVLAGLVIGIAITLRVVVAAGWDITAMLAFGEDSAEISDHAEVVLDAEVTRRSDLGHDGRFFFLQTVDPLYLEPAEHAALMDRPSYRAQRMLYPLIAGGLGLTPHPLVPWTMVIVNVLALALGTWATSLLAKRLGLSPWWGLAFALNLGLIGELSISGAGVVAFAAAMWAVEFLERDRPTSAVLMLTLAVLAREAMLLFVAGVALYAWITRRRVPWALVAWPAGAAAIWAAYVRIRLEPFSRGLEVQEIGIPFAGIVDAVPFWRDEPLDFAVAAILLAVLAVFAVRVVRSPSYLTWGCAGFIVLAPLLTRQVWINSYDITRAIAPVLTAFVLVAFGATRPRPAAPRDR